MIDRSVIVEAARALVNTPYGHQGRVPGLHGRVDCIGVPVLVAWAAGAKPRAWNVTGYRPIPDGHTMLRRLRSEMGREVAYADMRPGDLAVIDWGQFPHHVAIIGDYHLGGLSMIHADNIHRKVVEHRLVIDAPARFVTAFEFPGVGDV